nr:PA14 domain-containing protein [Micromonospora sp. DSM 115978]
MTPGTHTVEVEYYENGWDAIVRVNYSAAPPPACMSIEWQASYFPNTTLSGDPVTVRCETPLSYDFGEVGPGVPGIGGDNFSVRWVRTDEFRGGDSTFTVTADDGVRLYLDDTLVIDEWQDQGGVTCT